MTFGSDVMMVRDCRGTCSATRISYESQRSEWPGQSTAEFISPTMGSGSNCGYKVTLKFFTNSTGSFVHFDLSLLHDLTDCPLAK